jgi:hypothetical protein
MTTKREVIETHQQHPTWSSTMIAQHLGCMPEYVRATFMRNGLKLARSKSMRLDERERCAAIAEGMGSPEIAAMIRSGANA